MDLWIFLPFNNPWSKSHVATATITNFLLLTSNSRSADPSTPEAKIRASKLSTAPTIFSQILEEKKLHCRPQQQNLNTSNQFRNNRCNIKNPGETRPTTNSRTTDAISRTQVRQDQQPIQEQQLLWHLCIQHISPRTSHFLS